MTVVPLAEVHDYDGLVAALCLRVDQLGISYKTLEAVSGLADGHAGKILGDGQVKILGPTSLGLMLQGLAVKLLVVEDVEAARRMEKRWEKCRPEVRRKGNRSQTVSTKRVRSVMSRWMRDNSKTLALARISKIPPEKREAIARNAGKTRWRKVRAMKRAAKRKPLGRN